MQATFIIALIFAVLVAIFALLNGDVVTINLLFKKFEMSQSLIILISAILGAVSVFLMNLVNKVKTSLKIKELNKKLKTVEMENEALKERITFFEVEASEAAEAQSVSAETAPVEQTTESSLDTMAEPKDANL